MSIALMTEAWKSDMPSGRKFVLLSLCDNANDQGGCYPSIPMIAKRCSMSERTVQGHIQDLKKAGILTVLERYGRSSIYTINPRRICTPAESAPPQNLHPTPAESAPITVIEPSMEPSRNHHTPRKAVQVVKPEGVDEQVWTDFLAIRKAKRSPLSATALAGIGREADKAGITLADALVVCCERGWAAFRADWHAGRSAANLPRTAATQQPETFRERDERLARERMEKFLPGIAAKAPKPSGADRHVIDITPTFPSFPELGA